ncbi:hypothetical protein [Chitinimonas naiadis]
MRMVWSAVLSLAALVAGAAEQTASPTLKVNQLAREFVDFWDASKDLSTEQRVARFNKEIAPRFPAFYGIERYEGERTQAEQDKYIALAIERFGPMREAYLAKLTQFDRDLPRHIQSFSAVFPDYRPETATWLLHSLGEMDGGTREFKGQQYLIFGVDGMVRYHGESNEAAFFHHELFHTYHQKAFMDCAQPGTWERLWAEGLAVHVSKVLNPDANEKEMLLDMPKGMAARTEERLAASFARLETVLNSADPKHEAALFQFSKDDTGLSPRRGYYLGYLVAKEAGKTRDIHTLARMSCERVRPMVASIVHTLRLEAEQRQLVSKTQ